MCIFKQTYMYTVPNIETEEGKIITDQKEILSETSKSY